MRVDILSLFPEFFSTPLSVSILKRAIKQKLLDVHLPNIRDFSNGPHRRVDDRPYGGGPGMVMMAPPVLSAIRAVRSPCAHVVLLSPGGRPLQASRCQQLAEYPHLVLLCGHYEGLDARCMKEVDEEISIGDYVLTNGCLAAMVLLDAVARFIPGVLGHPDSSYEDSFSNGSLEFPHYTRPEVVEGERVPDVLLSGNHASIAAWRDAAALRRTRRMRPDLVDDCAAI